MGLTNIVTGIPGICMGISGPKGNAGGKDGNAGPAAGDCDGEDKSGVVGLGPKGRGGVGNVAPGVAAAGDPDAEGGDARDMRGDVADPG
ncbi:hypothetical protein HK102_012673, partial [Quaeritorhiza haematococci]